jgi:hypothetical protein
VPERRPVGLGARLDDAFERTLEEAMPSLL